MKNRTNNVKIIIMNNAYYNIFIKMQYTSKSSYLNEMNISFSVHTELLQKALSKCITE